MQAHIEVEICEYWYLATVKDTAGVVINPVYWGTYKETMEAAQKIVYEYFSSRGIDAIRKELINASSEKEYEDYWFWKIKTKNDNN